MKLEYVESTGDKTKDYATILKKYTDIRDMRKKSFIKEEFLIIDAGRAGKRFINSVDIPLIEGLRSMPAETRISLTALSLSDMETPLQ